MIRQEEIVEIGQYNKTHGIKGEISATLECDADEVERFSTLISLMDGIYVPFFVENSRPKNDHTVLLHLQGVESEKEAKRFVNKSIYVLRKELGDEEGEVPCACMVGYKIADSERKEIGEIVDIDDSTANLLFVVRDVAGRELYIPVAEEYILELDDDARVLYVDLPDGMLDL